MGRHGCEIPALADERNLDSLSVRLSFTLVIKVDRYRFSVMGTGLEAVVEAILLERLIRRPRV
jgi:hypothetical protein